MGWKYISVNVRQLDLREFGLKFHWVTPFVTKKIPEASSCKYLGIIIRSDSNWVDQVNYIAQKTWKSFHFEMHILKKGNNNRKSLAYTSMVRHILEYRAACWDPYREGQINALDWVRTKAAQFSNLTKDSDWESLAQRRMIADLLALFKGYSGDGLGKLYATGCEKLPIWVRLIMFGKLGTGSKERIYGSIPLWTGPLKTGTNCLQKR